MSTNTVNQVGGAIISGLTATGTNQATALQLANRSGLKEITSVGSSTGVILPAPKQPGTSITIANQGSNTLTIYPQVGGTIDNGSTNSSVTLVAGKSLTFEASSLTNWYTIGTTASLLGTIADKSVFGNTSGGTAAPAGVTLTAMIDEAIGNTQGNILYRGASAWSVLPPGTSGQYLETQGAAANPQWNTIAAGGTVTSVTFTGDGTVLSSTPSSAVTTSGTLAAALINQSANTVLAGPSSGSAAAPTYRAIGTADLPTLPIRMNAAFASRNLVM